jgi:hypothetical protein
MHEPLAGAFGLMDNFLNSSHYDLGINLSAVLKAVGDCLRNTEDADGFSVDPRVDHTLGEGLSREPYEV